jgi:hypothetical protein
MLDRIWTGKLAMQESPNRWGKQSSGQEESSHKALSYSTQEVSWVELCLWREHSYSLTTSSKLWADPGESICDLPCRRNHSWESQRAAKQLTSQTQYFFTNGNGYTWTSCPCSAQESPPCSSKAPGSQVLFASLACFPSIFATKAKWKGKMWRERDGHYSWSNKQLYPEAKFTLT